MATMYWKLLSIISILLQLVFIFKMFFKQKFIRILECSYFVFLGGAKRFFSLTSGGELNLHYFPNFFQGEITFQKLLQCNLLSTIQYTEDKQKWSVRYLEFIFWIYTMLYFCRCRIELLVSRSNYSFQISTTLIHIIF